MEHLSGKSVPSHRESIACYLWRIQGIREKKMKFFVNNEVQQLRDQRVSVKTHTHTHTPTYMSLNMHDTEIIRKMRLYVCACTFITYKNMHTHASTHTGTDICMVMYVSTRVCDTQALKCVCACSCTPMTNTYPHKHMHTHLKSTHSVLHQFN